MKQNTYTIRGNKKLRLTKEGKAFLISLLGVTVSIFLYRKITPRTVKIENLHIHFSGEGV